MPLLIASQRLPARGCPGLALPPTPLPAFLIYLPTPTIFIGRFVYAQICQLAVGWKIGVAWGMKTLEMLDAGRVVRRPATVCVPLLSCTSIDSRGSATTAPAKLGWCGRHECRFSCPAERQAEEAGISLVPLAFPVSACCGAPKKAVVIEQRCRLYQPTRLNWMDMILNTNTWIASKCSLSI